MSSTLESAIGVLAAEMAVTSPADSARTLERFSAAEIGEVLVGLEPQVAAPVVLALSHQVARAVLLSMEAGQAAALVAFMPSPWAAALLRGAPAARVQSILSTVPTLAAAAIKLALRHGSRSAAAILEPPGLALAPDVEAGFAIEQAMQPSFTGRDRVHVVDRSGHLVGVAGIADLLGATPESPLAAVMQSPVVSIQHDDDVAAIVANPGWQRWRSLPVVDRDDRLLGIVRFETVRRLALDELEPDADMLALPVSLAELFWLGLTGMTDGLARAVLSGSEDNDR